MTKLAFIPLVVMALASVAVAQDPAFDVASVKVTTLPAGGWSFLPSGEVRFAGSQLRIIVGVAFEVPPPLQELRIVWPEGLALRTAPRFEIVARGDPRHRPPAMLRTLLKERFGLSFHRETRTVPLYALTVKDRRRLQPVPYNCRQFIAGGGKPGDADSPRDGDREACFDVRLGVRVSAGTIQEFIEQVVIGGVAGERPVIDATGLSGNFLWEADAQRLRQPDGVNDVLGGLGFALEPRTGPWEVIVIDHVQMPTPN